MNAPPRLALQAVRVRSWSADFLIGVRAAPRLVRVYARKCAQSKIAGVCIGLVLSARDWKG